MNGVPVGCVGGGEVKGEFWEGGCGVNGEVEVWPVAWLDMLRANGLEDCWLAGEGIGGAFVYVGVICPVACGSIDCRKGFVVCGCCPVIVACWAGAKDCWPV